MGRTRRPPHRRGCDATLLVAEDIDVLGSPVDDSMGNQGVAAAQGKPVRRGGTQCDGRHLAMELTDRH
jgi:hypothetical protein